MSELSEMDDVRDLVRRAILDVLKDERTPVKDAVVYSPYEQHVPAQREITLVLRGSERAVRLLETAVADGKQLLEIAIGERFGPKARVEGRIA